MRVAHFIITRFCVRGGRWLNHVDGAWFSAVNPLRPRNVDFRLKLLETTCLPGVLSQTNRNFTWVLVVDANLDRRAKQRLEELARRAGRVWLQEYRAGAPTKWERLGWLEPLMDDRPDFVLTTVNDDDDALPRRFVETAQSHVTELDREGRLPPYKIICNKSAVYWHMAFTRKAPLGWTSPWRVSRRKMNRWMEMKVPACGFSLLCRYPAFDFSVLGLQHRYAESYFDFRARPPTRNVEINRRRLLEAARDARVGRIPTNADGFFDASAAGAAVITDHGGNQTSWQLTAGPDRDLRPVLGAHTFPDVCIDWDAARSYAGHFGGWRLMMRRAESALYGRKGARIEALRALRSRASPPPSSR